jgi:hypothetical protein
MYQGPGATPKQGKKWFWLQSQHPQADAFCSATINSGTANSAAHTNCLMMTSSGVPGARAALHSERKSTSCTQPLLTQHGAARRNYSKKANFAG